LKKIVIIASVLAGFLLMFGVASAEPTVEGPSGLIVNPTADVATPESAWIGVNYISWDDDALDSTIWSYTLTGGISENFELGAMGTFAQKADDGFGINAKYLVLKETPEMPGIACGINYTDIGSPITKVYAVGSKYFTADDSPAKKTMSVHAGVGYLDGKDMDSEWTIWGGADFNLNDKVIAIAEYLDANEGFDGLTYGLRYYGSDNWTAQAAMIDGNLMLGSSFIF
jgi:hypothetical protein